MRTEFQRLLRGQRAGSVCSILHVRADTAVVLEHCFFPRAAARLNTPLLHERAFPAQLHGQRLVLKTKHEARAHEPRQRREPSVRTIQRQIEVQHDVQLQAHPHLCADPLTGGPRPPTGSAAAIYRRVIHANCAVRRPPEEGPVLNIMHQPWARPFATQLACAPFMLKHR